MSHKVSGMIHRIFDAKTFGATFTKREFVVSIAENPRYPQLVSFEATKDRVAILDELYEGAEVEIEFNLRGREWTSPKGEVRYFTSLEAWRITKQGGAEKPRTSSTPADSRAATTGGGNDDDIPF